MKAPLPAKNTTIVAEVKKVTRFCGLTQKSPINQKKTGGHYISFSFYNSVGPIFEKATGLKLRQHTSQHGPYYFCELNDKQLAIAQEWLDKHKSLVFLNDSLDCSIALGMNMLTKGQHTLVGDLEHRAKEKGDAKALNKLVELTHQCLSTLPIYSTDIDFVAAIPKSTGKVSCIPEEIALAVSKLLGKPNLVSQMVWTNKTKSLKDDSSIEEKLADLENSGFVFTPPPSLKGKTVLLIDDLYQSGSTLSFIAHQLKKLGANKIIGLAIVKGLRNDANASIK